MPATGLRVYAEHQGPDSLLAERAIFKRHQTELQAREVVDSSLFDDIALTVNSGTATAEAASAVGSSTSFDDGSWDKWATYDGQADLPDNAPKTVVTLVPSSLASPSSYISTERTGRKPEHVASATRSSESKAESSTHSTSSSTLVTATASATTSASSTSRASRLSTQTEDEDEHEDEESSTTSEARPTSSIQTETESSTTSLASTSRAASTSTAGSRNTSPMSGNATSSHNSSLTNSSDTSDTSRAIQGVMSTKLTWIAGLALAAGYFVSAEGI